MNKHCVLYICLTLLLSTSGCGKPAKLGFLEQKGVKNPHSVAFIMVQMAEDGGSYRITDKTTVERAYTLLNKAEHTSGMSKYIRPNVVTLVYGNGQTLSFAFGLWNPALTWDYKSEAFVEFVKTDIVRKANYANRMRIPTFSIDQAVKVIGPSTLPMSLTKVQKVGGVVRLMASAYVPHSWNTTATDWDFIATNLTSSNPGYEVILSKPVHFQTLVSKETVEWTGPASAYGSRALQLKTLTVDKMLVYMADKDLYLAFHSGKAWYVTGGFGEKQLGGKTPEAVYKELVSR